MSLFSDYRAKFAVLRDGRRPRSVRWFAAAEIVCLPLSILSALAVAVLAVLGRTGTWVPPPFARTWLLPVAVSAAVGYLTNWMAITMLFEPYGRTWRHWLPWCTFGVWRQGLLPKNKARIAAVLADQVATRLLRPEKLADDLCGMAGAALQDPGVIRAARDLLQEKVAEHEAEIAEFLAPRLEAVLVDQIDRLVTEERLREFWDEEIMPRLESEENREALAQLALRALRTRAPEIAAKAKPAIARAVRRFVEDKFRGTLSNLPLPLFGSAIGDAIGSALASSADALADYFLDEKAIENAIRDWIRNPDTAASLRDELAGLLGAFRDWTASEEGASRIGGFADGLRARFKNYLRGWLRENLAPAAARLLRSDALWTHLAGLLPSLRPGIERMIRETGTRAIVAKLDVEGRVKAAVDGMDMAEFHAMLSTIMAEHLGAIQVLGYLLGALAGLLLAAA
ncbi:MAG: DUF445 family protein [Kiritimatiellae bacterium]|nr:DUF445 family protein [Kiritimatiellia bacterium]